VGVGVGVLRCSSILYDQYHVGGYCAN
jgi:hypothetical protein